MHVNVLLTGRLEGLGQQTPCELMARRNASSGPEKFVYHDPVIIHVPSDLPEGEYSLHFEGVSVPVLHRGVLWTMMAPPISEEEAAAQAAPSKHGWGPVALARRMLHDRRKK
ncbi:MAG TPA: hypothetical protein VG267_11640 [Terracidiphilus sp.]|nr:hypothetical protein [Terracidiphilus sp.]